MIKIHTVSNNKEALQSLVAKIARTKTLVPSGNSHSLAAAQKKLTEYRPDVVLISSEFTQHPTFEAATTLFSHSGVRWLVFDDVAKPDTIETWPQKRSNLFSLSTTISPRFLEHQIACLCHTKTTPTSGQQFQSTHTISRSWHKTVLIGSSTGGIDALITILKTYPKDCPPTIIVQHTGTQFIPSLANLLNSKTQASVQIATTNAPLNTGCIYLAGSSRHHIQVSNLSGKNRCRLIDPDSSSLHVPSIDTVFESAVSLGPSSIGVLLTGMGKDGCDGLGKMKRAGAKTIVQDEKTSTVYGMPRIAWETGAASIKLPIQEIGPQILEIAQERQSIRVPERKDT